MAVRVVTDSACGLRPEELRPLGITVVPHGILLGGELKPDTSVTDRDLEDLLAGELRGLGREGALPPSPHDFEAAFRGAAVHTDDVLAVLISAKLSATVASGKRAAELIKSKRLPSRFALLDSEACGAQQGFAALAAAEAAANGGDLDDCIAAARAAMARTRLLLVPQSLAYLVRTTQVSKGPSLLERALHMCPVLTLEDGDIAAMTTVRTYGKALQACADRFRSDIERAGLRRAVVHHVLRPDEARAYAGAVIEPLARRPIPTAPLGPIVGLHTGPAIGIVYETVEPLR